MHVTVQFSGFSVNLKTWLYGLSSRQFVGYCLHLTFHWKQWNHSIPVQSPLSIIGLSMSVNPQSFRQLHANKLQESTFTHPPAPMCRIHRAVGFSRTPILLVAFGHKILVVAGELPFRNGESILLNEGLWFYRRSRQFELISFEQAWTLTFAEWSVRT